MSQRQLIAIMFTDLVGYSALTQRNESLALELLEKHWELLRPVFARYEGREIKTVGDAFLIEFPSALRAVEAGLAMQDTLEQYNRTVDDARMIRLRIGIHCGDVERRGGDVFGDGVNIASRIEPLAQAGCRHFCNPGRSGRGFEPIAGGSRRRMSQQLEDDRIRPALLGHSAILGIQIHRGPLERRHEGAIGPREQRPGPGTEMH